MPMKEAEKGIRYLCGMWAKQRDTAAPNGASHDFSDFYAWVQSKHSTYLDFKAATTVRNMVEMWFDNEFKQSLRR
jgi:hypothetical protein